MLAMIWREMMTDIPQVNILTDDKCMARLSDFGLAVFAEGMSKNYASVRAGADHWLGPELLDPERFGFQDDRPMYAGDIYSFGCMCLEVNLLVFFQYNPLIDLLVTASCIPGRIHFWAYLTLPSRNMSLMATGPQGHHFMSMSRWLTVCGG